jgi:hypothetical protein
LVLEIILVLDTEVIEANASHLNQKVMILYKSSRFFILEVEYFSTAKGRSPASIQ